MATIKLTGLKGGRPTTIGDTDTALIDGSMTIGDDAAEDVVTVNAEFASDLIPDSDDAFDLGSNAKKWRSIYANNLSGNGQDITNIPAAGNTGQVQYNNGGGLDGTGHLYYKAGKVGIGDFTITDPDSFLHVKGNLGGGQNAGTILVDDYLSSASGPYFSLRKGRGDVVNPVIVNSGDTLGTIYFQGYNSNSSPPFEPGAAIAAYVDGSPGGANNDMPGALTFKTSPDGSASPVHRMTIKSTGLTGVGTTDPKYLIHAQGDTGDSGNAGMIAAEDYGGIAYLILRSANGTLASPTSMADGDTVGSIAFAGYNSNDSSSSKFETGAQINAVVDGNPAGGDNDMPLSLEFKTSPDGSAYPPITRMTINSTGYVGIGTTTPQGRFHVQGTNNPAQAVLTNYNANLVAQDNLGEIFFGGTENNTNFGYSVKILAETTENWQTGANEGSTLAFYTTPTGSATRSTMPNLYLYAGSGARVEEYFRVQHDQAAGPKINLSANTNTIISGSTLGTLQWQGFTGYTDTASIKVQGANTWAGGVSSSKMIFSITGSDPADTETEVMRIFEGGVHIADPAQGTYQGYELALSSTSNATLGLSAQAETLKSIRWASHSGQSPTRYLMEYNNIKDELQLNSSASTLGIVILGDLNQYILNSKPTATYGQLVIGTVSGSPQYANFDISSNTGLYSEGYDTGQTVSTIVNRSETDSSGCLSLILGKGYYTKQGSALTHDQAETTNHFVRFYDKLRGLSLPSSADPLDYPADGRTQIGSISGNGSGGVSFNQSFTGFHASVIDTAENAQVGMIVESTGVIWHQSETNVSTALPKTTLSASENSKTVYGVVATFDDLFPGYYTVSPPTATETAVVINSLGEGKVWVTNINGNIENGDYITTSQINGYGQKQTDDILHSYTVAKCTETIDWSSISETIDHNGISYKKYLLSCTYHCG